jgi:hypothetical protein
VAKVLVFITPAAAYFVAEGAIVRFLYACPASSKTTVATARPCISQRVFEVVPQRETTKGLRGTQAAEEETQRLKTLEKLPNGVSFQWVYFSFAK